MAVKTCPRCGKAKPLTEFNRWRESPDGRAARCSACAAERKADAAALAARGEKRCAICKLAKPLDEFRKRSQGRNGRGAWCNDCCAERSHQYRLDNLEHCRKQGRDGHKRRRFGDPDYYRNNHAREAEGDPDYYRRNGLRSNFRMTLEEFEARVTAQGGVCAVCCKPPRPGRRLEVDHDHDCCPGSRSCGECIRDLLCSGCNGGTGIVDNPELLRKKAAYLLDWRERHGRSTRAE